jgi:hypothetical protein
MRDLRLASASAGVCTLMHLSQRRPKTLRQHRTALVVLRCTSPAEWERWKRSRFGRGIARGPPAPELSAPCIRHVGASLEDRRQRPYDLQ